MRRHEAWRAAYGLNRYMIDATEEQVAQRSRDICANMLRLSEEGQITPGPIVEARQIWWELWTHILEECGLREVDFRYLELMERERFDRWLTNSPPRGVTLLRGASLPAEPYLAKLGEVEHLRAAYAEGRFRVAPAGGYNDPSLNSAVRDDELCVTATRHSRRTKIQGIDPQTGKTSKPIELRGEISYSARMKGNYYVWCAAREYDVRLIDDFEYHAGLIIKDPSEFYRRFGAAVREVRPDLRMHVGSVRYYDPYFIDVSDVWVPMLKHFRYAYQAEVRCVWISESREPNWDPFFVELGDISDIAELYELI